MELLGIGHLSCAHEWARDSDVYVHCSTKETPIVMLPYKYLSYFIANKERFPVDNILRLWDYARIFPETLEKGLGGMGNKHSYWSKIDTEIVALTGTTPSMFNVHMQKANSIIKECIAQSLNLLEEMKRDILKQVDYRIRNIGEAELREEFLEFKRHKETETIDRLITNIRSHRMT